MILNIKEMTIIARALRAHQYDLEKQYQTAMGAEASVINTSRLRIYRIVRKSAIAPVKKRVYGLSATSKRPLSLGSLQLAIRLRPAGLQPAVIQSIMLSPSTVTGQRSSYPKQLAVSASASPFTPSTKQDILSI